jgi:RNA-directed DNA polymerase
MRDAGADRPVVAMRPGNAGGAKGAGHPGVLSGQPQLREKPVSKPRPKPFAISKEVVWKAYLKVKANKGAAGVDEESIEEFERNLKGNLAKLWNRMSSGSYLPTPVRMVEIPKPGGQGVRVLGVPTVADRIAQTVVKTYLEPEVEPLFHPDSYGYRPGRSALQAVGRCRERCWRADWVIDLDIKAFFDTLDHELVMRAVRKHSDLKWVHLYVQRWLTAPMQRADGSLVARDRGSPQGSAISPLLANLFMHYAFDSWLKRTFPQVQFERYCDDAVIHCATQKQAEQVRDALAERLKECRLELHDEKTRIVYCQDANRRGSHEHQRFSFLGYEFRARICESKEGKHFVGFTPAVSPESCKAVRRTMRSWRLLRWSGRTLQEVAHAVNGVVRGWINYYGRYHRSQLWSTFVRLNEHLIRWARRKYKRFRRHNKRAWQFLAAVARREPDLFVHWRFGVCP